MKDKKEKWTQFTSEFLHSTEIADFPPRDLKLKDNTIIMLICNLDILEGICNALEQCLFIRNPEFDLRPSNPVHGIESDSGDEII